MLFNNNAHAMCVTREQLYYDELYSYNRFRAEPARRRAGGDVPRLASVDVAELGELPAALGARWPTTGRRSSASSARPTKSRRSHRFSAAQPSHNPLTAEETMTDVAARA